MSVYRAAIESGDFCFSLLVAESGVLCPRCGTADCASYHGRWRRKLVRDLASGEIFKDLPILRARFCSGTTKSLMPAELWRGRTTIRSVLATVIHAVEDGLDAALQWAMHTGDGEEMVSERSVRRWLKRSTDRVPVAAVALDFPSPGGLHPAGKLQDFLECLRPVNLLQLRHRWGYSLLDVPGTPQPPRTATRPRPGHQNPCGPHKVPSKYLRRGTRSRLSRRGHPPDE